MSPVQLVPPPALPAARRAVRTAVGRLGRPLRVIAEDLRGLDRVLDLVCADPGGRVVLVLLGEEAGGDLELVADGLAQRAWLEPRLADWHKLAPGLEVDPAQGVELLLVAPEFEARAREAARAAGGVGLARVRFATEGGGASPEAILEPVGSPVPRGTGSSAAPEPHRGDGPPRRRRPAFRTGLSDADLRLAPPGGGEA